MKKLNYKGGKVLDPIELVVDRLGLEPRSFTFYLNDLFISVLLSIYFNTKNKLQQLILHLFCYLVFWSFSSEISVSNPGKTGWKWKWESLSSVWLFVTPWTIQSMKFSRPEHWSG